jgi:hypothetical protein
MAKEAGDVWQGDRGAEWRGELKGIVKLVAHAAELGSRWVFAEVGVNFVAQLAW